jgi:hypothetical protein
MVIGTALGLRNAATAVLAIALAFLFGYSFTLVPVPRSGLALRAALGVPPAADTVSINVMEIADSAIMLVISGAMDAGLRTVCLCTRWSCTSSSRSPRWLPSRWRCGRGSYGIPVLTLAVFSLAASFLARESGDELAEAVDHQSPALDAHVSRADTVLPAMLVYVVLLAATVMLDRRTIQKGQTAVIVRAGTVSLVRAAIAGLVATVVVIGTGHAGATATWSGTL